MPFNPSNRFKGISLVLVAGTSWGLIGLFARSLSRIGLGALDITALRGFFTGLALLATIPLANPKAMKVRLRDIWCMAGCGIASITFFNICYFATLQRTSIGIAVVLLYTSPVFVTVLSHFCFGEVFRKKTFIALALVTAGCVLVSGITGSGGLTFCSLLTGLGSGFCYALYSIFGRFAQQRGYSSIAITLWSFIFAATAALFIMDWRNVLPILGTRSPWLPLAGLVLVSTILPYFTYTAGLRLLPPSTAAITATIEPVVGTLVGIVVFGESLTASAIAGMALIIGALFL